jgi:hypothetical protein
MRKVTAIITVVTAGLIVRASAAHGALVLGWVDEFTAGHAECYRPNGASVMTCTTASLFNTGFWAAATGNNASTAPAWAYFGAQGANATGRANARGKVMFRFNGTNGSDGSGFSVTTSYARFRIAAASIPPLGGTCSTQGTYIGQMTQTFDSYSAGASGVRINNRLLPVFDYSAETSTGDVGYRDVIGFAGGATQSGCYKIQWL